MPDALLYVPPDYRADRPAPFAVMLHGASGSPHRGLQPVIALADDAGLLLLAPQSRSGRTWDLLLGGFGPDVETIDRHLREVFGRYAIDESRIAIGGFSDGASYALSLGVTNGDLFTHILALSPGFIFPGETRGAPRIYVSHGTDDRVLPIEHCSRHFVPLLQREGYQVRYREFDGPHTVPTDIAREAVDWFTAGG